MAKNPIITDEAKLLIQQFHSRHPRWKAKDIQIRVSQVLHSRNLQLPPGWPGLSSVQKHLAKIKNRDSDPRDKPWSFSYLAEYPIAPEAIPLVVSIYEKCLLEDASGDWLFSIREALWIGRLHKIIEMYKPKHILPDVRDAVMHEVIHKRAVPTRPEGEEPTLEELALAWGIEGKEIPLEDIILEWAYTYSQYEILSEDEGKPFDSGELDGYMMSNVYEFYGDRRDDYIEQMAEKYDVDEDKLRDPNLSIGDVGQIALKEKIEKIKSEKLKKEAQNEGSHTSKG